MKEKFINIKKVSLNNNCPECYSKDGLQLTFKQKFIETPFYKSMTNEISQKLKCNICHSIIYPERWTDDIEGVFEYQKKAFEPKKKIFRLKKLAWFLISIPIALIVIATIIILFL
ncbi:hypothetical protein APS56_12185 [Pseudalgibacter alginicilyticus]|uniref:Uncharacterized protein n=1 Tax=Pseudalgibacter alginicilyticus TaxID=1736674 RepID=A0A0P0CMV9_9FLAO|nr:hypothetical protein [Pseudalgibacter alginicilyticus]ALJ05840.1 hypothetical protein APS56_12185 [Pseudalgibacter alginicilyticus]